jgi:hypothetical protein
MPQQVLDLVLQTDLKYVLLSPSQMNNNTDGGSVILDLLEDYKSG